MNIKLILQTIRLSIGKLILDKKTPKNATPLSPKKILFLRQDGKIGDYIVSSFVFREIKKFNPEIKIGVVCTTKGAYLFKQNPHIDQLYFVKKRSIFDYIKCGLSLAKESYDVAIDPTLLIRNRDLLLLRLINAKNYIGYKKQNYKLFNFSINQEQLHFSEVYAEAIKLCGIENIDISYDIPNHSDKKEDIAHFIKENHLANCIAINFFGAASSRKFKEQNICLFIEKLQSENKRVLLLTYPEVTPLLKSISEKYANAFVYEKTENIFDTIALLHHSSLVISPDTSIVHIASGLNKQIIAFYKLADKENFAHWNPNCKNKTHIINFVENVNEISPEDVLEVIR